MQKSIIRDLIVILIIVFVLELTVFNLNSYRIFSSKNKTVFADKDMEYSAFEEGVTSVKVSNVNKEIKTVHLEVENYKYVDYQFFYTDKTTSVLLETPTKKFVDSLENSKYISTHLSGESKEFEIRLYGDDVKLSYLSINEKIPMKFNFARVVILFGTLVLAYSLKKFQIFKIPFSKRNLKQEFILVAILGVFLCLICFINDNSREKDYFDFYSRDFVEALSQGKISLEKTPSSKLTDMENPYDARGRAEAGVIRDQDYIWDAALYDGKYYVYFGILPALILFVPYHLITGKFLISAIGVLIFSILCAIAIKALVEIVFLKHFKEVPFKYTVLSLIIMLFGSQILFLNGVPRFYELPISAGLFFAVAGIDFVLMGTGEKRKYFRIFLGCLFLALAVSCRPTMLFASFVIVPTLVKLFIENVKNKKCIVKNILAVAIPYLIVGILLMIYNYSRFGSIFEFGAKYQLTINDMTHLSNRFSTIFMGLVCNLFSIPFIVPSFPFIVNHNNLVAFYGYYYIENMIGGLFILVPICFAIFKAKTVFKKSENRELVEFIITLIVVGLIICVLSIIMGGSMQRYIVDYGWMFVLAGICIFLELQNNIYESAEVKQILKKVFAFIAIYVVIINTLAGIVSEKSNMMNKSPEKFYKVKYTADFWE